MNLAISEYVDLSKYSTMRLGGQARYFAEVDSENNLQELKKFADKVKLPLFILGGGSNVVFSGGILPMVVVKMAIKGFKIIEDQPDYSLIEVGAGENWDSVVERSIALGLSGIESLSAIPGTAGATPVQNIGAYGCEIKNVLEKLRVFDLKSGEAITLSNVDCHFRYRDSIFRNEEKGRYIILSVLLRLSKKPPSMPDYPDVRRYFTEKGITRPTLGEIREAVIKIRSIKLPDPAVVPNVGSFFKNPVVTREEFKKIKSSFPDIKFFELENGKIKIPAGWLIEQCGLKGYDFGRLAIYDKNALVLINKGGASFANLEDLKNLIIEKVFQKFGLRLAPEPIFAG